MSKRRTVRTGAGVGVGVIFAVPAVAQADDFLVTNTNGFGSGSFREAVEEASSNPGSDRVLFKSKLSGTIELTDQSMDSYRAVYVYGDDLEIVGPGARKLEVNASSGFRALTVLGDGVYSNPPIDVSISGLTVSGGSGGSPSFSDGNGGGILELGGLDLNLSRVTISGNSATFGGGVAVRAAGGQYGDLTVENSTISGNSAVSEGGGLFFYGNELSVRSSTISGNSADGEGGGVAMLGTDSDTAAVLNSTVTANQAGYAGGLYEEGDGSLIRGSIIAGNTGSPADLDDGPWATAFSLIGDTAVADITDQGGNLLNADPKLKPLKDNGGPTDTHAFKKSPAKNKGPSDAPNSDQRGAPRKGKPDIGAYEFTKCEGVVVNRVGTAGKDKLKGTKRKDGMLGLGGNDKLKGKKGKDGLCGGQGKDKLKGGPGKDKLNGGPGKDKEIQ
jgi:hypothetical protein